MPPAAIAFRAPATWVTNWPAYEAGLRRRGDLTLWLDEAALDGWAAPKRSTPGRQPRYSERAIEPVLTLRLVFRLALRQAEAFSRGVLRLLGWGLTVPDHSTLSRRGRAFAGRQPRVQAGIDPVHLVLWTARGWTCSAKASGMPRSMAGHVGSGASCTWPSMLKQERSPPTC